MRKHFLKEMNIKVTWQQSLAAVGVLELVYSADIENVDIHLDIYV